MSKLTKTKRSTCSLGECIATGLPGLVGAHGSKKVENEKYLLNLSNQSLFKSKPLNTDPLQPHKTKGLFL